MLVQPNGASMPRPLVPVVLPFLLIACAPAALTQDIADTGDAPFMGQSDQPDQPDLVAVDIDPADAELIAESFVQHMGLTSVPPWKDAWVGDAVLFTDADGQPVLFESAVYSPDGAAGYVAVGAAEGRGVIVGFRGEGSSRADRLLTDLETMVGADLPASELEFLTDGAARYGLEWHTSRWQADRLAVAPPVAVQDLDGANVVITYSPLLGAVDASTWRQTFAAPSLNSGSDLTAEQDRREIYLLGGDDLLAKALDGPVTSVGPEHTAAAGVVGSGASSFITVDQERRTWSSGRCYSGCTPLAAATALSYWDDSRGYSGLMPDPHTSTTGSGLRSALDDLREEMGTTCSGSTGLTPPGGAIGDGIAGFAASRGFAGWTTADHYKTDPSRTLWYRIKNQIDDNRPVLLHWSGSPGHSVLVYEYTNNSGDTDDWVCYKNGDGTAYDCMNRKPNNWVQLTRLRP